MTPRQRAYALAKERGMTVTTNYENGIAVRVEAPRGHNFGGEHEMVTYRHSGSNWRGVIDSIIDARVYPCDEQSDCWHDGACEWWLSESPDLPEEE